MTILPVQPAYGPDPLSATAEDESPSTTRHMKTYTAGEDKSRLAAAAKELGLEHSRRQRQQVRKSKVSVHSRPGQLLSILLDSSTEEARMKSFLSVHDDLQDGDVFSLMLHDATLVATHPPIEEDDHEVAGGSMVAAVLGIVKGMVGPAILYLPNGFAFAGYLVALPILTVTTVFFLYSARCLLESWQYEQDNSYDESTALLRTTPPKRRVLSYPELAYRALGVYGEGLTKTGIALMQSGVCLTYLIFVPQNLHTFAAHSFGIDIPARGWLVLMVIIQIPLSWLRDIRKLTHTNLLANALILYGLFVCLGFALVESVDGMDAPMTNFAKHAEALVPYKSTWYLLVGTSVLLFEGSITLLIPLQEAVHGVEHRKQFPVVFERSILGVIVFYAIFGLFCWLGFGSGVRTILTTSLPPVFLASTTQLAYSIAVIFTFPLQNFPALEITTRTIRNVLDPNKSKGYLGRNVISSCLVVVLAAVALCMMDSLDKVVSLMGSLLGCPITFVVPPLIHSSLVPGISTKRKWANRIVIAFGLVAMISASAVTISTW